MSESLFCKKAIIFLHSLYSLIRDEQAILAGQDGVLQQLKEPSSISCTTTNFLVDEIQRLL